MELNNALFASNGGCGYVLKPNSIQRKFQRDLQPPWFIRIHVTSIEYNKVGYICTAIAKAQRNPIDIHN
jgi:hypothetical protein